MRVPPECVPGVEPEVAEEAQAGLGVAVIFGGHDPWLGAAHHQLADMSNRHLAVLVVDDPEIEAGHRAAGDVDRGHVVVADDRNVHLGGPVAGADADTETSTKIVEGIHERNHQHALHRVAQVVRSGLLACQKVGHRPEQEADRRPRLLHDRPEIGNAESPANDRGGADLKARVHQRPLAGDVKEGQRGEVHVRLRELNGLARELRVGVRVGVRDAHALGRTGRPRRVHDGDDLLLGDVRDVALGELGRAVVDAFPAVAPQAVRARRLARHQEVAQASAIGAEIPHALGVAVIDHHQRRARILDLVPKDLAEILRVDRHLDRAEERQPEPGVDELDRVVEHDQHRVATPHSLAGQGGGGAAGARPQLGVGVRGLAEIDRGLAAPGARGRFEHMADRASSVDNGRHAGIVAHALRPLRVDCASMGR